MVRPVSANHPVTLGYRERANFDPNYVHRGIDYGCPKGTAVVATKAGKVVYAGSGAGYGPAYGIHVVIWTGDSYDLYAHLSEELVHVGQGINEGQLIAWSGATGNVRGAHLHYQECLAAPPHYTSDRRPQHISMTTPPVAPGAVTTFPASFWNLAHPKWYTPWAPRAAVISAEIRDEAEIHGFAEVMSDYQIDTIEQALGPNFTQVSGRAGLEFWFDHTKWELDGRYAPRSYASGVQDRYALVVHLRNKATFQHVAFVVTHAPALSSSLRVKFGAWLKKLLTQIDGPVVLMGDLNNSSNKKSPRKDIRSLGFRDMRELAAIKNESSPEFPSKGSSLSDILIIPKGASITGGEIDLTPSKASDHRRIEAIIKVVAPGKAPSPTPDPTPGKGIPLELWKETLPVGKEDGKPTEWFPIGTHEMAPYFVNHGEKGITFRAPVDGVTTSKSGYPRSELREMDEDGELADWSSDDGENILTGTFAATVLPGGKDELVAAQIHDDIDDVVMILVDGSKVFVSESLGKGNGSKRHPMLTGYELGDRLEYEIHASAAGIRITINGVELFLEDKVCHNAYFKAGCYSQANESNGTGYAEVIYYALKIEHK